VEGGANLLFRKKLSRWEKEADTKQTAPAIGCNKKKEKGNGENQIPQEKEPGMRYSMRSIVGLVQWGEAGKHSPDRPKDEKKLR